MKLWAHRGCSQRYPENTLLSFEKAAELKNIEGVELDIQLTKDGEIVVIHDEKVDRTTEGIGFVKDYTLSDLKKLHIYADDNPTQSIPTMKEVIECLHDRLNDGFRINIELKTSKIPYPGIEEKIAELIGRYGFEENIVYSSFYANSVYKMSKLSPKSEFAILDTKVSDCLWKVKGGCATSLHPSWRGMDLTAKELEGYTVRAWFSGHLYPEKPTGTKLDFATLAKQGITDVIINEPEVY